LKNNKLYTLIPCLLPAQAGRRRATLLPSAASRKEKGAILKSVSIAPLAHSQMGEGRGERGRGVREKGKF